MYVCKIYIYIAHFFLFIYLFVELSMYLSIHIFIYMFIYYTICLYDIYIYKNAYIYI